MGAKVSDMLGKRRRRRVGKEGGPTSPPAGLLPALIDIVLISSSSRRTCVLKAPLSCLSANIVSSCKVMFGFF